MTHVELELQGMSCAHCVRAVEQALRAVPGVQTVKVEVGHAAVDAADGTPRDALVTAVEAEGYRVVGR